MDEHTCVYVSIKDTSIINECLYTCFISQIESKNYQMALKDSSWVEAMQEELAQFEKMEVWKLVEKPHNVNAIGTKWVFKCMRD